MYHSGKRTPDWRKLKILSEQEFVVAGWTEPKQTRMHLGALVLGVHDDGDLRYAGRVGTGFDDRELAKLIKLLKPLETGRQPAEQRAAHERENPLGEADRSSRRSGSPSGPRTAASATRCIWGCGTTRRRAM